MVLVACVCGLCNKQIVQRRHKKQEKIGQQRKKKENGREKEWRGRASAYCQDSCAFFAIAGKSLGEEIAYNEQRY